MPENDRLRISEIFASIQGEGVWAGTPSTFVRVSGCNLRCTWCDTPYASWAPEGPMMSVPEIVSQVRELGVRHVVLTGGEPMLFAPVEALASRLTELGYVLTIETAGTVFRDVRCDLMSISPKLSNSTPSASLVSGRSSSVVLGPSSFVGRRGPSEGERESVGASENRPPGGSDRSGGRQGGGLRDPMPQPNGLVSESWRKRHEATRTNLEPLRRLLAAYTYQLKFVIDPEGPHDDLGEIQALLTQLGDVPADRVMLMAEGTDAATLTRRERLLAPVCVEHGYRLSPRLHVHWFGNTRGT